MSIQAQNPKIPPLFIKGLPLDPIAVPLAPVPQKSLILRVKEAVCEIFRKIANYIASCFRCFRPQAKAEGSIEQPEAPYRIKMIKANKREGNPTEITVPIGDVSHLKLCPDNFPKILKIANSDTLNKPYPLGDTPISFHNKKAYRPNHNGTHSARQAAHLSAMFTLIEKKGSQTAKAVYQSLTDKEKMNLRLGAYFLRAGRVDESNHASSPADDYYSRSALIYEQYAVQMGEDTTTIDWVKKLIVNACKPPKIRDSDIDTVPKNLFGYEILTMVHQLDLIRCFGPETMDAIFKSMSNRVEYFVSAPFLSGQGKERCMHDLLNHAKQLCSATGCARAYDGNKGDLAKFMDCSTEGDYCWKQVSAVPFLLR